MHGRWPGAFGNDYVSNSEYDVLLAHLLTVAPTRNVMVVFTEDLHANANAVLRDCWLFLGLDPSRVSVAVGYRQSCMPMAATYA